MLLALNRTKRSRKIPLPGALFGDVSARPSSVRADQAAGRTASRPRSGTPSSLPICLGAAAVLIWATVACSHESNRIVGEAGAQSIAPTGTGTSAPVGQHTPTSVVGSAATSYSSTPTAVTDSSVGLEWESIGGGSWILEDETFRETARSAADSRLITAGEGIPNRVGVDLQWSGGLAGLVIRYRDENEWVMAWVLDSGKQLVAGEKTRERFIERGRVDYAWGEPGTTRRVEVVDSSDSVAVYVDGVRVLQFVAPSTGDPGRGTGLFNRASDRNRFARFSNIPILSADPTPTGIPLREQEGTSPEGPQMSAPMPQDSSGWQTIGGIWSIAGDAAIEEISGSDRDSRLITSVESADALIQVRVISESGAGGIVASYGDERNWLMAWCDPGGHIVVGQNVDGSYGELARAAVDCGPGSSGHTLGVRRNGSLFRVLLDDVMVREVRSPRFAGFTESGLFARGAGVAFRDFAVSESPALFSMPRAITAFDRPSVVPFGMLSDPSSDFGIDGLFLFRKEVTSESIVSGYPFGLITRKFALSGHWPADLALNAFYVATESGQRGLTYATEWGRTPDGQRNGWVGWADDGAGNPTHIARSHASDGVTTVDSTVFTQDGAVTYLWDVDNLRDLSVAYEWTTRGGSIANARVLAIDGSDVAVVEGSPGAWLAVVGAGGGERTIEAALTPEGSALVRVGFPYVDLADGRLAITIGWSGTSLDEAIERALSGATIRGVEQRLVAARDAWRDLQSGAKFPDGVTEGDEWFVRSILNHVASQSVETSEDHWYLIPSTGGVNQHAWIRDTFVTALGVARFHPEMAANMIRWMADHPGASNILGAEWFHYDGTTGTNRSTNIDTIAWLALSVGRVYNALPQSERAPFALQTRGLVNQVYDYVSARWDQGAGHIDISPHGDHDWWDNWARRQDTGIANSEFKFEMGSEVIFASALRLLVPVYEVLDAPSRAGDFAFWGAELEASSVRTRGV